LGPSGSDGHVLVNVLQGPVGATQAWWIRRDAPAAADVLPGKIVRLASGATVDQPEYRFKIDAFTPETFPMARLADYMGDLAVLLGEQEHVHFVRLEPGSTVLVQRIDRESAPRVRDRIRALRPSEGQGAGDALSAFKAIDRRLAEDNATGELCGDGGAQIIRFPGREQPQPQPLTFGAFRQPGRLDGVLIRLGGMGETVPVHLEDECAVHHCFATREMARRLARHLYEAPLRVHGAGRWERDAEGAWQLKRFDIADFETLDDSPLGVVLARLRRVPGSDWRAVHDSYAEFEAEKAHDD
jgi:hypothetical protein